MTIMVARAQQQGPETLVGGHGRKLLEAWIPQPAPAKNGRTGRPRVEDRAAVEGILFVTENGIAGTKRPTERGFGSGIACRHRSRAWRQAGV
jgi:transposase